MTALSVQPPYPIFTDKDGEELRNGYIYIGVANQDPRTNPITVYWDIGLTVPAVQPIRTINGYPSNNGVAGRLYVNSDYSIRVENKNTVLVYNSPVATERYSGGVISRINASQVDYDPAGTGAVQTSVQSKLRESVSVKDFGAVGDGVADDTAAIQAALDNTFNAGGGAVFVPSGEYLISKPLIVRSNTDFYGAGASSVIKRTENFISTPEHDLIHIGYGYEWNASGQKFNPASNNDATLIELIANNFSNITTYNASVRNMTVKANGGGMGIWTLNAGNIVIDSIWSDDTITPVNIANDAPGWEAGCFNVSVSNIFQVSANTAAGRSWYDLVFGGSAIKCNISRCFNNPDTPSALDGSIVLSGSLYWTITDNVIIHKARIANVGKRAILSSALSANTDTGTIIANNTIRTALDGVWTKGSNYVIANNAINDCLNGVSIDGSINLISGNTFTNNTTDVGGSTVMVQNSFIGNIGLNTAVVSGFAFDPREYNTFTSNTNSSFLFNNNDSWPQLKARYIVLFPIDAYLFDTDKAKVAAISDGALRVTAPNTISMYFKLPAFVRQVSKVILNGYAAGAGDAFNPQFVGFDGPQNANAMAVIENIPSQSTGGTGDFTMNFTPNDPFFAQGTYYLRVNFTSANTNTQFRNIQLKAMCDA